MTKKTWYKKYTCQELCKYHTDQFTKWWDPDLFDWKDSWYLAQFCFKDFDIWWDAEKFNWRDSWVLTKYCSNYFNIWWDAEKFNWRYSWVLIKYCTKYFNIWWDPNKWNWKTGSTHLAKYCAKYLNKWWNPDKFNWYKLTGAYTELTEYCAPEFSNLQLKQLLLHPNKLAREFAIEELQRRENDKRRMVE